MRNEDTLNNGEDWAVEQAEHQLAEPTSLNMQLLQSTLPAGADAPVPPAPDFSSMFGNSQTGNQPPHPGGGLGGLAPAYSGAALLAATSFAGFSNASSPVGLVMQVASAAPVAMGKPTVGESATLNALGAQALANAPDVKALATMPELPKQIVNTAQLDDAGALAATPDIDALNSTFDSALDAAALLGLIESLDANPDAESLQAAIDVIETQIDLLTNTFDGVMENLGAEVQGLVDSQNGLDGADLGVSMMDDAGSLSSALTDLLGTINVNSNPQLNGLLNLDSTLDQIAGLVGSLPGVDLSPVITPILDPISDIIGTITDPVTGIVGDVVGGITDPVTGIVGDVVGGITDPVTGIVGDVVGGITEPVTDVVDGVLGGITTPVLEPVLGGGGLLSGLINTSESTDPGLVGTLGSAISSNAGGAGSPLDGVLGALDPNK